MFHVLTCRLSGGLVPPTHSDLSELDSALVTRQDAVRGALSRRPSDGATVTLRVNGTAVKQLQPPRIHPPLDPRTGVREESHPSDYTKECICVDILVSGSG